MNLSRVPTVQVVNQGIDIPHIIFLFLSFSRHCSPKAWSRTLGSAERLISFVWLAHIYPDAVLLFSGGSGSLTDQKHRPADTARKIFDQSGLDPERIRFELNSKNTAENALKSYELIQPSPDQHWVLVTSAYHMPRSVGLFRKAGWNVIPYPVDFQTTKSFSLKFDLREIGRLSQGIREWLGLIVYRVIGDTLTFFPGPKE